MEEYNLEIRGEALQIYKILSKEDQDKMPFQGIQISKILQRIPFFKRFFDLNSQNFINLCITEQACDFDQNSLVYECQQEEKFLYIILQGSVSLSTSEGQLSLGIFQIFGETEILFKLQQRHERVVCKNSCKFMKIKESSLMKIFANEQFLTKSLHFLNVNPYFQHLEEFEKMKVSLKLVKQSFEPNQILTRQQESMNKIYFLIYGKLEVLKQLPNNKLKQFVIDQIHEMGSFGEYECINKIGSQVKVRGKSAGSYYCLNWHQISHVLFKLVQIISRYAIPYPDSSELIFLHEVKKQTKNRNRKSCENTSIIPTSLDDIYILNFVIQKIHMGNSKSQEVSSILIKRREDDWMKINDLGYCQIWKNKMNHKIYQVYSIPSRMANDHEQLEKYVFRKNHENNLVTIDGIIVQDDGIFCSEPQLSYVLVENIICRLGAFERSLSFEEGLYVLSSASGGYNTLNSFFGPLQPSNDLICFNGQGKVKVWLNQQLQKNQPSISAKSIQNLRIKESNQQDYNMAKKRTQQCVYKLFELVQNTQRQRFPHSFKEQIKDISTYFEAINFIENYCQTNRIKLPEHLNINDQPFVTQTNDNFQIRRSEASRNGSQNNIRLDSSTVRNVVVVDSKDTIRSPKAINQCGMFPHPQTTKVVTAFQPLTPVHQRQIQKTPKISFSIQPKNNQMLSNASMGPRQTVFYERKAPVQQKKLIRNLSPPTHQSPSKNIRITFNKQMKKESHIVNQSFKTIQQKKESEEIIVSKQRSHKNSQAMFTQLRELDKQQPEIIPLKEETKVAQIHNKQIQKLAQSEQQQNISEASFKQKQQSFEQQKQQPKEQQREIKYFVEDVDQKSVNMESQPNEEELPEKYSQNGASNSQIELESKKENNQIQQWEQKLLQMSVKKEKKEEIQESYKNQTQEKKINDSKKFQTFAKLNNISQTPVIEPQDEYYPSEKIVKLQQNDLEQYIREKYQTYLQQDRQSECNTYQFQQTVPPSKYFSSTVNNDFRSNNYTSSNFEKKRNSYETTYNHENYNNNYQSNNPYTQYESKYQVYHEKDDIEKRVSKISKGSFNSSGVPFYDYVDQNLDKKKKSQYYNVSYQEDISSRYSKKSKVRNSENKNIDEKYKKYVLNAQRHKPVLEENKFKGAVNSKQYSMILPAINEPSKTHISPMKSSEYQIITKSRKSERRSPKKSVKFEGDSMISGINGKTQRRVTYDKLRALLWQQ